MAKCMGFVLYESPCSIELCNVSSVLLSLRSNLLFCIHFRNVVSSPAGVRVVEIRDENGLVLSSWQFLKSDGVQEFELPSDALLERSLNLIAEDSIGNILKHQFP
jgi:hypothetical protein